MYRLNAQDILARNVKNAAPFLSAMAGKSEQDSLIDEMPFYKTPDYALSRSKPNLRGIKIGVPTSLVGKLEPEEAKGFAVAISVLKMLEATVVYNVVILAKKRWSTHDG